MDGNLPGGLFLCGLFDCFRFSFSSRGSCLAGIRISIDFGRGFLAILLEGKNPPSVSATLLRGDLGIRVTCAVVIVELVPSMVLALRSG